MFFEFTFIYTPGIFTSGKHWTELKYSKSTVIQELVATRVPTCGGAAGVGSPGTGVGPNTSMNVTVFPRGAAEPLFTVSGRSTAQELSTLSTRKISVDPLINVPTGPGPGKKKFAVKLSQHPFGLITTGRVFATGMAGFAPRKGISQDVAHPEVVGPVAQSCSSAINFSISATQLESYS
jgi:hypothetical protein